MKEENLYMEFCDLCNKPITSEDPLRSGGDTISTICMACWTSFSFADIKRNNKAL